MKPSFLFPLLFSSALLTGCFGKVEPEPIVCDDPAHVCVTASVSCSAPALATAVCDAAARTWRCPAGSTVYARAEAAGATCEPFSAEGSADVSPFASIGGSLTRVPIDGGRCLWVAETATTADGTALRNVGLLAATSMPFGTCPSVSTFAGGAPTPVAVIEGPSDPSLLIQVDGGFVQAGKTIVPYRLFRVDMEATYGVTLLGGGFGRWDVATQRVVVPGESDLLWDGSIDPGDASLVIDGTPYVWGCHGPATGLTNPCSLSRLEGDTLQFLTDGDVWLADAAVSQTITTFSSGPWISSVVARAAGLQHVYASSFSTTLQTDTATDVTGPWAAGPALGACVLPANDPAAYCAGPVVHEELMDPTRPNEWVVSYGVGTTGSAAGGVSGTLSTSYTTKLTWFGGS
jgi:hypothetical protein